MNVLIDFKPNSGQSIFEWKAGNCVSEQHNIKWIWILSQTGFHTVTDFSQKYDTSLIVKAA